jgi:hypothetical protein
MGHVVVHVEEDENTRALIEAMNAARKKQQMAPALSIEYCRRFAPLGKISLWSDEWMTIRGNFYHVLSQQPDCHVCFSL